MNIIDLRSLKLPEETQVGRKLRPMLVPLTWMYWLGVRLWRAFPVRCRDIDLPVISIGSLAVGGTGKTPLTIHIAQRLVANSIRVAIVSRGWKRQSTKDVVAVSDGVQMLASVYEAGDEPYLMAMRVPGAAVYVSKDRYKAAVAAKRITKAHIILLDDGFQYRRLKKALEIICLDGRTIPPNAKLLPLGPMREPFSILEPENIVVVMEYAEAKALEKKLGCEVVCAQSQVSTLVDAELNPMSKEAIEGKRLIAISGIANPSGFESSCARLGLSPVVSLRYDDHKWYHEGDEARILKVMKDENCQMIVTTEKDIIKLPEGLKPYAVALRKDIALTDSRFWRRIEEAIARYVS